MLVLLPPSEGKADGGEGPPVRPERLLRPALAPVRERVLDALVALCQGPQEAAREVLGLSPGQTDAILRNQGLRSAPTRPAAELYTGVLYDNLGLATLGPAARARAAEQLLIFSGLWGALAIDDAVPAYRLSMAVRLPRLGALAGVWRPALTRELAGLAEGRLLVDMRSAPYAAAWRVRSVTVRIVQERVVKGVPKRTVISHMAKATRGEVARALLQHDVQATTGEELCKALLDLGYQAELDGSVLTIVINL